MNTKKPATTTQAITIPTMAPVDFFSLYWLFQVHLESELQNSKDFNDYIQNCINNYYL